MATNEIVERIIKYRMAAEDNEMLPGVYYVTPAEYTELLKGIYNVGFSASAAGCVLRVHGVVVEVADASE